MKQGSVQFTIFVSSQEIVKVRELIPHIGLYYQGNTSQVIFRLCRVLEILGRA